MKSIIFSNGQKYTPSKIIGIGRNYDKHIQEMKSRPTEEPVIFIKPNSALQDITQPIEIPKNHGTVHHEVELAVCMGKRTRAVKEAEAMKYVAGYGLALDLTLRDVQARAKQEGLPWSLAKGFDGACPVSEFVDKAKIGDVYDLTLSLSVNGQVRQHSNTGFMIFKIPYLISYISQWITLLKGDLIITGTPEGVGPLQSGDKIEAGISHIAQIRTAVK